MEFWKSLLDCHLRLREIRAKSSKRRNKELEMAKSKKEPVRFEVRDGIRPTRHGAAKVFNLMAPLARDIPPDGEVTIDLQVSCKYPLHVFQTKSMLARGLVLPDGLWAAVDADTSLKLVIRNTSDKLQLLERKDIVARAYIMDNNDLEDSEA